MKATAEELNQMTFQQVLDQFESKVREGSRDIRPEYGWLLDRQSQLSAALAVCKAAKAINKIWLVEIALDEEKELCNKITAYEAKYGAIE